MLPNGETRLVPILGHPTTQVKSPEHLTRIFEERNHNAVSFAIDVEPASLDHVLTAAARIQNLDGMVVTVPHKRNAAAVCAELTDRARHAGAVNIMRRRADGTFYGDQCDGVGLVAAAKKLGCRFEGARALLFGAGGAGTAIAYAMAEAGVAMLDIADPDSESARCLISGLEQKGFPARLAEGSIGHYQVVINASPVGMGTTESPIDVMQLSEGCFVGDVVTMPAVTQLIAMARQRGLSCCTGADMYKAVADEMLTFLYDENPTAES